RLAQQARDRGSPQRRLEGEVAEMADRALEQAPGLVPGGRVGLALGQRGVVGPDRARGLVGIDVVGAALANHRAGNARLAAAVGSREHVDPAHRRPYGTSETGVSIDLRPRSAKLSTMFANPSGQRFLARFFAEATAAAPSCLGVASNAAAIARRASGRCMRAYVSS